jgi:hypothetical protein
VRSRKAAAIFQPAENLGPDSLHRTVADLLEWVLYYPTVFTTFPAGWGKLAKSTGGRLRAAGLKAGFPDILVFHDGRVVGLELKVKNRKPSAAQQLMFPRLRQCGMQIYVCQSVDDVIAALNEAKVPVRWLNIRDDRYETSDANAEARSAQELT